MLKILFVKFKYLFETTVFCKAIDQIKLKLKHKKIKKIKKLLKNIIITVKNCRLNIELFRRNQCYK
ncbi:hypothetical protein COB21_01060 [Candidatus Aerophobetes bacterium]|uniref:Uncharacterized protein n=1 Tax=Aerophobetes bacterium TaxID=2030807 RepID=A0A2A4X7Z9_UNCAE|nr:MAG: hypothetical protein COB21_01060 [Candidatus Aerophobetes bacterium]